MIGPCTFVVRSQAHATPVTPQAMEWLVKMYADSVNISVSHNRALQAVCLRLGVYDIEEHVPPVFVSYFAPVRN